MTLGQLKAEIIEWIGSGFCHLTQSNAATCKQYYPLSFWNLTVGQFLFVIFLGIVFFGCIFFLLDDNLTHTRSK